MIDRWIIDRLNNALAHNPAVALLGPRQVGKTTLAHYIAQSIPSLYLDLESPEDLVKLNDPIAFLSLHQDKLVILDEIQRAPALFMALRGLIDEARRRGNKGRQFLLLGSASIDLLKQSSESLAGRIAYLEMSVLNASEIQAEEHQPQRLPTLWLQGGFPESYLAPNAQVATEWLENFVRSYLERDLPQLGAQSATTKLRRFWTMIAHLQGQTINCSQLGGNLELDAKTISHYLDLLVDLLLVRRLEPWHVNVKKRLVKSPRFYIRDSGIVHRLLGIGDYDTLLAHPILGPSWEGFVVENITSVLPLNTQCYFYRTAAGAEIDLVIQFGAQETWAVEMKHGRVPKISRGFHEASADIEATHKYVVYSGYDTFPMGQNTTVISVMGLMNKIINRATPKS